MRHAFIHLPYLCPEAGPVMSDDGDGDGGGESAVGWGRDANHIVGQLVLMGCWKCWDCRCLWECWW